MAQPFSWKLLGQYTFAFQIEGLGVLVRAISGTSAAPSLCFIPGAAIEETTPQNVALNVPESYTLVRNANLGQ